ncbi:MAG: hypothetical protein ACR2OZ_02355 [Verrucomicrobiales bacterium]
MNSITYDALEAQARPRSRMAARWLRRVAFGVWKYAVGILLCMIPFASILVVGWTSRLMQRMAFKAWWKQSHRPYKKLLRFRDVAATTPGWIEQASWPNWIVSQNIAEDLRRGRVHKLFAGLWINLKLGVQMMFNTSVILAVPCLMWSFAWYAGWQVSFNKAYEYFQNGALLGLAGSIVFGVAMFYVPMAQARQAVSGNWRAFYDFRFVRRVIRRRWFVCAVLAAAYAVAGFIVMILISIVPLNVKWQEWLNTLAHDKTLQTMRGYFLGATFVIFPLYFGLRWAAARIYASAVGRMLGTGEISPSQLTSAERLAFPPELVNAPETRADWTKWERLIAWSKSVPGRTILGVVVFLAWSVFVFEIFVSQFFIARGPRVWLNHPLVQLPWTDYTPPAINEPL